MKNIILEITNYKSVINACKDSLAHNKMIGIIGDAGSGKTTALEHFRNKYPQNVFIVTVYPTMTAKIFYSSVLNVFGDSKYETSDQLYFIMQKAVNLYKNFGENKLLIIDEAGKLKPRMFEYLHEFRDKTRENTGIILAGVDYFKSNIIKWRNSGVIGIPEFCSRIHSWQELVKLKKEELISIIKENGIDDEDFIKACIGITDLRVLRNHIEDYLTLIINDDGE